MQGHALAGTVAKRGKAFDYCEIALSTLTKIRSLFIITGILILCVLGCSNYYTKLYLIGDPPKDYLGWDGDEVISDFQGWKFHLEIIGTIDDPNWKEFVADSFGIHIYAIPESPNSLGDDRISIDQPYAILESSATRFELLPYSYYEVQGTRCFIYRDIYIASAEQHIEVVFKIIITKGNGSKYERECKFALHRYETKEKSIPKGLFN
ncbi:hypothetical protein TRIP_C20451 [Candidatus Zixiibacteriota bacterium]|nr:hypothetical protein TRIP_C20451 [candidate division Zixibacteria bacterium]